MVRNYSNVAVETSLNGAVNSTVTAWTVADGSTYPAVPFAARCEDEVVLVTAKSGTNDVNWTVERHFDGTTAASHSDTTAVDHVVIADDMARIWGTVSGDDDLATRIATVAPAHHWPLNETAGATASDELGSGWGLTYVNSPILDSTGIAPDAAGCPDFNGTTQGISIPGVIEGPGSDRTQTWAFWMEPDSVTGDHIIIEQSGTTTGHAVATTGTDLVLYAWESSSQQVKATASGAIAANNVYFVVAVVDSVLGTVRLYLDGEEVDTDTDSSNNGHTWGGTDDGGIAYVNANSRLPDNTPTSSNYYDGKLSHLMMWSRQLLPGEVRYLYDGTYRLQVGGTSFSGVYAYNDAAQTGIVTSTATALTFNQEVFDTDGYHSASTNPTRLTAPAAGYYLIGANVQWDTNTGGIREILIRKNGTTPYLTEVVQTAITNRIQYTEVIAHLDAGDYVEATVYQDSGSNRSTRDSPNVEEQNGMWMYRLHSSGAVKLDDLTDVDVTTTAPAAGDMLQYDGTDWVPGVIGSGAFLNRTLEFEDATTDATKLTVGGGTVAYNGTESAIEVSVNSRCYYNQKTLANLGEWFDIEFDAKGKSSSVANFLTAYEDSGWSSYMLRIDWRGGQSNRSLRTASGSWATITDYNSSSFNITGYYNDDWIPLVLSRRGTHFFLAVRDARGIPGRVLTSFQHSEYLTPTTRYAFGVSGDSVGSGTYFRNVKMYKYSGEPELSTGSVAGVSGMFMLMGG